VWGEEPFGPSTNAGQDNVVNRRKPSVAEEIQQTKPFPTPAHEASVGLLRTTDILRRRLNLVAGRHGITIQQYNVLRILRGAGEEGLPTLSVAERMVEQTPGITRLIDRLEAKGLVRRARCREDRRQVLCWITETGLAVIEALESPIFQVVAGSFAGMNDEEQRSLIDFLDRIRAAERTPEKDQPGGLA
jgi:MarR family transcriptional regulator, organic hydroperoxide resistance regulator